MRNRFIPVSFQSRDVYHHNEAPLRFFIVKDNEGVVVSLKDWFDTS